MNIKIKIPFDQQNKSDTRVQCGINGRFWDIKRGEEVVVPREVFTLLDEGGYSPSMLGEVAEEPTELLPCKYCGKGLKNALGLAKHEEYCEKNPASPKYKP